MFGDAVGMVLPHDIDAGGQREIEERLHEPQLLLIRHVIWSGEAISDVALDEKVMEKDKLLKVLDPLPMTKGGVQ